MIDLEKIKNRIMAGENVEDVLSKLDWAGFEEAVAEILSQNEFVLKRNFRFKIGDRYEIDIIAAKTGKVLSIDCKEWRGGRRKKSGIVKAAEAQKQRTKQLKNFISKNPIARNYFKIGEKAKYTPVIVTLLEEEVKEVDGTLVVPAWKLNSFLNSDMF